MSRDHLRVCGADLYILYTLSFGNGSPPRVRSRLGDDLHALMQGGITSACAEQTGSGANARFPPRDHLRVCGADDIAAIVNAATEGSPPRVRSRRVGFHVLCVAPRITSACAEQTRTLALSALFSGDHLRVCGADRVQPNRCEVLVGSPPRVRSRRRDRERTHVPTGITSACAEQTTRIWLDRSSIEDHLRVCGADGLPLEVCRNGEGSPPRVRSRPVSPPWSVPWSGITSACAEQTRDRTTTPLKSSQLHRLGVPSSG